LGRQRRQIQNYPHFTGIEAVPGRIRQVAGKCTQCRLRQEAMKFLLIFGSRYRFMASGGGTDK